MNRLSTSIINVANTINHLADINRTQVSASKQFLHTMAPKASESLVEKGAQFALEQTNAYYEGFSIWLLRVAISTEIVAHPVDSYKRFQSAVHAAVSAAIQPPQ